MPKRLQKFLQHYLSKLKNPRPQIRSSSSKNWILSGCKQPKTPSFAMARRNDDAATLSDIDRFLSENFRSLFIGDDEDNSTSNNNNNNTIRVPDQETRGAPRSSSIWFGSTPLPDPTSPDLRGSLDGSSNSHKSIAVLTCSASPYEDFRRSMREMVEARLMNYERVDWGFMEELLFCYLNLNEKKSHRFILSAFVDVVNVLRGRCWERVPATAKPRSFRMVRIGREKRRKKTKEITLELVEKKNAATTGEVREENVGIEL